jgi:hypothetical protein
MSHAMMTSTKTQNMMMYQILCGHVNYALGKTRMQVKNTKRHFIFGRRKSGPPSFETTIQKQIWAVVPLIFNFIRYGLLKNFIHCQYQYPF